MFHMNKNTYEVDPSHNGRNYNVFFTNLANPLKIGIILSLRKRGKSVSEITKELNVEQSKVSHALQSLKSCNIVTMKQNGKSRVYSLNKNTIIPMLSLIDKHASTYCNCESCTNGCGKK